MARLRFAVGTRYTLDGRVYRVRQVLPGDLLLVEDHQRGTQQQVSVADLHAAWGRGVLRFELHDPNQMVSADASRATRYTLADFQTLPERYRVEAWRRYELLLPLLRMPPQARTRRAIATYSASLRSPDVPLLPGRSQRGALGTATSWASLERWLAAFVASGYDVRSLVPATSLHRNTGQHRLDPAVEAIIADVFATCRAKPAHRTRQDVYLQIVQRIAEQNRSRPPDTSLALPSHATVYRRIAAAGAAPITARRPTRAEVQATGAVFPGPDPQHPLARVELDHTLLDLFLVDETDRLPIGRPTLTLALDVYSGYPFGCYVGFEPPSYRSVMNCLLHGILPKDDTCARFGTQHPWLAYGLPDTLVVDRGREFTGRDLVDACGQLGIVLDHMPARTPWFKGTIERHFRTTNTGLVHMLPGTTFAPFAAYGESPPAQQACISLTAFWHVLHVFLLDVYAERWHTGIEAIPSQRWRAAVAQGFVPALPRSAEDVRILLFSTKECTVQRIGIQFETLRYQSTELARLRSVARAGERVVRIKYDPGDLGAIYVQDPTELGHWFYVPAVNQEYAAGLSVWKHRLIRRAVTAQRQAVDITALAAAKQRLQALVEQEFRQTRSLQTRKRAARYREVGTGPLPSTSVIQDHASAPSASPTAPSTTTVQGQQALTSPASSAAGVAVTPETDDVVDGTRSLGSVPNGTQSLGSVPSGNDDADLARIRAEFGGDFGLRRREDDA